MCRWTADGHTFVVAVCRSGHLCSVCLAVWSWRPQLRIGDGDALMKSAVSFEFSPFFLLPCSSGSCFLHPGALNVGCAVGCWTHPWGWGVVPHGYSFVWGRSLVFNAQSAMTVTSEWICVSFRQWKWPNVWCGWFAVKRQWTSISRFGMRFYRKPTSRLGLCWNCACTFLDKFCHFSECAYMHTCNRGMTALLKLCMQRRNYALVETCVYKRGIVVLLRLCKQ